MPGVNPTAVRGLGLCSGGLDSILAALVLARQGIAVTWIAFETPFFTAAKARRAAGRYRIPLIVQDITEVYLEMLKNPHCGYGKQMNPCLDCHALMFRLAGAVMMENGFDFLFSGEVAGQRPMSQTKPSLRYVEKHSGFQGLIVRPLSAQLLPITAVEAKGLVNRDLLLSFCGRSRKPQIALAKQMGVTDYPAPAGGCLLTDKGFGTRLRDLLAHRPDCRRSELELLRFGRHFRLDPTVKLIVGRTQTDNDSIQHLVDPNHDMVLTVRGYPGPTGLLPADASADAITRAAAICAGYTKAPPNQDVNVLVQGPSGGSTVTVMPLAPDRVRDVML